MNLKQIAEQDALAGKPISSFYDIPDIDHNEEARAQYEKAWRGTEAELRREGF